MHRPVRQRPLPGRELAVLRRRDQRRLRPAGGRPGPGGSERDGAAPRHPLPGPAQRRPGGGAAARPPPPRRRAPWQRSPTGRSRPTGTPPGGHPERPPGPSAVRLAPTPRPRTGGQAAGARRPAPAAPARAQRRSICRRASHAPSTSSEPGRRSADRDRTDAPKIVTRHLGNPESWTLRALPGRRTATRACARRSPWTREDIHEEVNTANLLGRGGAGFEAGRKWGMLRKAEPIYLVDQRRRERAGHLQGPHAHRAAIPTRSSRAP